VVSDFPRETKPNAADFPPRNRIISGLAVGLVAVEAGEGGGALIMADFDADQGREVSGALGGICTRRAAAVTG
jgi:DNA processing protein